MTSPAGDPVQQHIFNTLNPRRGTVPSHVVENISNNIAFLIKYIAGPSILASQISIPVINIHGPALNYIGRKATVCIHQGPGNFIVVLWAQVNWNEALMTGLSDKVDRVVKHILTHHEDDGSSDFIA